MIRTYLFIVVAIFHSIGIAKAQTYNTVNDITGNWHNAASWTSSIAGSSNGTTTTLNEKNSLTNINGKITLNENLSISGNNATLTINSYDTLVINGDLSTSGSGNVNVESNGVLIITGNTSFSGKADLDNNAVIVVMGDFTEGGSSTITDNSGTNEGIYVFGSSSDPSLTKTESEAQSEIPGIYSEYVAPLPIELLSFSAVTSSQTVQLKWTTAMEENFDAFEVERAGASLQFEVVGTVKGNGFSTSSIDYDFEDTNPHYGINYYRLKAIDLDGSVEYHKIISVYHDQNKTTRIYPNPIVDQAFTINSSASQITLLNSIGHAILSQEISSESQTITLSSNLQAGSYIALFTYANGEQERQHLIIGK